MSSTITAPTYDPTSTATSLAQKAISDAQSQLTAQTNTANATATALTQLNSAISTFQTSLSSLAGLGKSVLAQSATLSNTSVGSATAKSSAAAGTYNVFVQQVATAGQATYDNVPDASNPAGTLTLTVGSAAPITVNLATANTDGGQLSVREIAAAINNSSSNTGLVSAGVITVPVVDAQGNVTGSEMRLVLTSKNTGAANTISMSVSGGDAALQTALNTPTTSTAGKDAIIWLNGENTGTQITQGSNTFTNIDGVSLTITHAQVSGDPPVALTVDTDASGTTKNVQTFVDAYNKLKSTLDGMLNPGDPAGKTAAGAFANDAGVKALQSRLVSLLRTSVGGLSLASYGITGARDGTLQLDSSRLSRQLASNPGGLDQLMGSVSTAGASGVLGGLNTYLNQWSDVTTGQIHERSDANAKLQTNLSKRQDDLNTQYDAAYQRYLKQFTDLQTLQAQMNSNVSMFDALFGNQSP